MKAKAFGMELEKRAVSAAKALAVLRQRAVQGARVSPSVLQAASHELGAPATSSGLRGLVQRASESVKATTKMQVSLQNPVVQQAHAKLNTGYGAALANKPGIYDKGKLLQEGYDHGPTAAVVHPHGRALGYTQGHINSLATNSQLVDPHGLLHGSIRTGTQRSLTPGSNDVTKPLIARKQAI